MVKVQDVIEEMKERNVKGKQFKSPQSKCKQIKKTGSQPTKECWLVVYFYHELFSHKAL